MHGLVLTNQAAFRPHILRELLGSYWKMEHVCVGVSWSTAL